VRSFIGKEKDAKSNLGDFGVRKYEDFSGRFTSIYSLWKDEIAWSPYHYCRNNPVARVDACGLFDIKVFLPDDRTKTGSLYVIDRQGKTVFSMEVKVKII
jgi:RHS repeat-associated protein